MLKFFATLLLLMSVTGDVYADEIRPGYLELNTTDGNIYSVKWKVPMKGDMVLSLDPVLPDVCSERTPPGSMQSGGAMITRWSLLCPEGIFGKNIRIGGLENTMTDVLVRLVHQHGFTQMMRLTPGETSFEIAAEPSSLDVIQVYTALGIEHILIGVDHLLFVFALLLIVNGLRRLIGTITAFTLAHSITLAAATLGYIHVPQAPVEAVIALSILFLATEIVHNRQGRPGLANRFPWVVAFIFGLLHGFGFAGALAEIGLPEQSIPLALLFFNVGVELGQLMFVAAVVGAGWALKKVVWQRALSGGEVVASYVMGGTAAFWVIERTYSFWS
ncbi:MAG: HupE/UreJ family protein [Gammaproteobacteria bacterium]|nr:HupE/UreJ family protein [Gammaproteobacteria bacterium]